MKNHFFEIRNTERLKKLYKKLHAGEKTSIVILGGSVSSGHGVKKEESFAMLLNQWLCKAYNNDKVKVYNYAAPGMSSIIGLYFSKRYIEKLSPDLVILEFAINDKKNFEHQFAYESLILSLLNMNCKPATVSLITKSESNYSCRQQMNLVDKHYGQSSIFLCDALNSIKWSDYSCDYGHPHVEGNQFIFKLIKNFLIEGEKLSDTKPLILNDTPFFENKAQLIELSQKNFQPVNIYEDKDFTIHFSGNTILIIHMIFTRPGYTDAIMYIDDKEYTKLTGFEINSWSRLNGRLFTLECAEKKEHTLTIKAKKGEKNKCFSLQNIGFC